MLRGIFKKPVLRSAVLAPVLMGLVSCAATVKQSADLAQVGVHYAGAMDVLLEVTADRLIDDDSEELLYLQSLVSDQDKKGESDRLSGYLHDHDAAIKPLIETMARFQRHTRILKSYFINLQVLANTDAPQRTATAVQELSGSIHQANEVFIKSDKLEISPPEKEALGKLAGMAAKGIQAAQLRAALERDAPVVGEQLLLHEKLLEKLAAMLKQSYDEKLTDLKKKEINRPYVNKAIQDPEAWKKTRKELLKASYFEQKLQDVMAAVRQMRIIWEAMLAGKQDFESVRLLLVEINEFTDVVRQLKEAQQEGEKADE